MSAIRTQRLAEAVAAQRAATRRVVAIIGRHREAAPWDEMQALAHAFARLNNDTPHKQARRLSIVNRDARAMATSRR